MDKDSKIYVAGGANGMVGTAIVRKLKQEGYTNIEVYTHEQLDLRDQIAVDHHFYYKQPEYVFLAAAKVGGILANDTLRGEFIYDNIMIQTNIIHAAHKFGVKKLLFLGSSCIYPREYTSPWKEEDLMSAPLEPTNEPYAVAKIAGIKMIEAYRDQYGFNGISVMPPNLYGRGDNYNKENTHVVPMLIRRFHEAKINRDKEVTVWGSGKPYRELMYVEDLAECCIFLMNNYDERLFINTGTGEEVSIFALAHMISQVVDFKGNIVFDTSKPDGTLRKVMDLSRIQKLGWKASMHLPYGLQLAYKYFKEEYGK